MSDPPRTGEDWLANPAAAADKAAVRLPTRPLPAALLIGLVAQALFCWRLTTPHMLMFDEVHYVPAARTLASLSGPANIEHPLVGKTLIALGILALDPTPLVLPADLPVDPVNLYLFGGFVCFVLIAVLLVVFIGQISRNLRS
ncbi:MAG: hypothetical protein ACK4ZY_09920, partial [Sphingomonas sp.]